MKKTLLIGALAASALLLAACGSSQADSASSGSRVKLVKTTKASSASHKKSSTAKSKSGSTTTSSSSSSQSASSESVDEKITDEEWALMGFEKLDGQGLDNLLRNADHGQWGQEDGVYLIGFGAHITSMEVQKDSVVVTYDDAIVGGGMKTRSVTYSKKDLAAEDGDDTAKFDEFLQKVAENGYPALGQSSSSDQDSDSYNGDQTSDSQSSQDVDTIGDQDVEY